MLNQEIREKIIQKAISFEAYGLNDLAWTRENAIILIESIMMDNIGILGGDVYKLISKHLEFLSDNWACEKNSYESEKEFFLRSKIESLKYIKKYPIEQNENILFSITFTEQICL